MNLAADSRQPDRRFASPVTEFLQTSPVCVGEHVESVFLPIQVRGTAGLSAGAGIYLPSRQASASTIFICLFISHLL